MTFIANMTMPQLAKAVADYRIDLPPHSPMRLPSGKQPTGSRMPSIDWPAGADVAGVLADLSEAPFARVISFSADAVEEHHIVRAGDHNNAIYSLVADDVGLIHGMSDDQLVGTFAETFSATQAAPPAGINFEFSESTTAVFFGMVDRLRLMVFSSYIERTGLVSLSIGIDDIQEQLVKGGKVADFRWLSAIYPIVSDQTTVTTKKSIAAAMDELAENNIVSILKNGRNVLYDPSPEVLAVAIDLLTPLPCLVFPAADPDQHAKTTVDALVSGRSIWHLNLNVGATTFGSIDGLAAMGVISENLLSSELNAQSDIAPDASSGAEPDIEPDTEPAVKNTFCEGCNAELKSNMKFCTQCGKSR